MLVGAVQPPRTSARAASRKPPAPDQVLEEADPLPHPLVEQGVPEALAARREPGPGEGELPGGLGAGRAGRCARSVPISGTTTSSIPGARLRGTGTTTSPRAAIDTASDRRRARGGRASSATRSEVSPSCVIDGGVVVELLAGGGAEDVEHARRRSRCSTRRGPRWPGRRRRAVCRAWRTCPTRSSQAAPWRRSSSIRARRATTPPWEWAIRSIGTPGAPAATCSTRSASRRPVARRSAWVSAAP